jgi:hypothetical protein
MSGDSVALDDVEIAESVLDAWTSCVSMSMRELVRTGRITDPSQVPDAQLAWLVNGALELFIDIPSVTRLSMNILPHEWWWIEK